MERGEDLETGNTTSAAPAATATAASTAEGAGSGIDTGSTLTPALNIRSIVSQDGGNKFSDLGELLCTSSCAILMCLCALAMIGLGIAILVYTGMGCKESYDWWTSYTKDEINGYCNNKYNKINEGTLDFENDMLAGYVCAILIGGCFGFLILMVCCIVGLGAIMGDAIEEIGEMCGLCCGGLMAITMYSANLCIAIVSINYYFYYFKKIKHHCDHDTEFYDEFIEIGDWFEGICLTNFIFFLMGIVSTCRRCASS